MTVSHIDYNPTWIILFTRARPVGSTSASFLSFFSAGRGRRVRTKVTRNNRDEFYFEHDSLVYDCKCMSSYVCGRLRRQQKVSRRLQEMMGLKPIIKGKTLN